jgi:hypothetical protein
VTVPYATGEIPVPGDYVKNQWEQSGAVTGVQATQDGLERINIRWDDGAFDLPLAFAEEFTLISRRST